MWLKVLVEDVQKTLAILLGIFEYSLLLLDENYKEKRQSNHQMLGGVFDSCLEVAFLGGSRLIRWTVFRYYPEDLRAVSGLRDTFRGTSGDLRGSPGIL